MSIEKVKKYFSRFDMEDRILEFEVSSATVDLAAKAVNCEPKRIAKSLSFKLKKQDVFILVVTAGDARIDNKKYKEEFGEKATMLTPDETVKNIGYPVGGVCPFDVNESVKIYLDVSLKRFQSVFPACGSGNSAIELTMDELEKYVKYVDWVDVCKDWMVTK